MHERQTVEPEAERTSWAGMGAEVSVVVVSHNNRAEIARCLEGVTALEGAEVLLVDSGSSDDTTTLARRWNRAVSVHGLDENEGFGAAANRGVTHVDRPYVLILNADAWPEDGAVERLVEHAREHSTVALFGPSLVNVDGSAQRSLFAYPRSPVSLAAWVAFPNLVSRAYQLFRGLAIRRKVGRRLRLVDEPEYPAGAAILVRRAVFEELGGFDERFFMYSEETDLCCRMRAAGWGIAYVPEARFRHVGGASTASQPDLMYAHQLLSHLILLAKHRSRASAETGRRLLLAVLAVRAAVSRPARAARPRTAARLLRSPDARAMLESVAA